MWIGKVTLLVASLLFIVASSQAAIVLQVLSPTHIVMNSSNYNVEAKAGKFIIQPISPDPTIRVGVATVTWEDSVDELIYDNGSIPCPETQFPTHSLNLSGSRPQLRRQHTFKRDKIFTAERAADGSVTISGNATTSSGCSWKFGFMFVENDTLITMPEISTMVQPYQVKLSIEAHCPWKRQIFFAEPTLDPAGPLHLRGRLTRAGLRTSFEFGAPLNNIFDFHFPKFFPGDMNVHMQRQCVSNVSTAVVSDFRPMPWNYTFDESVGIIFPFEAGKFAIGMLTWARSDSGIHTWAVPLANETRIAPDGRSFLVVTDLYFEFAEDLFYDPTLDILFNSQRSSAPTEAGSPAAAVLAADNTAVTIAIGVVVAVAILAVIVVIVFVIRSPSARAKIMPYGRRREPREDRSNKDSNAAATAENAQKDREEKNEVFARPASPSAWSAAQPLNRNV